MKTLSLHKRRMARDVARVGAADSLFMFLIASLVALGTTSSRVDAATNAGSVQILVPSGTPLAGQPLASGGSATAFALTPPSGSTCTGDSATGGYRVQTYMVPVAVDPSTLTFDAAGPVPAASGAAYRQPMFSAVGSAFVNKTTAVSTGLLTGLPTFSFAWVGSDGTAFLPAGTYNIGYACTKGTASATQLDKFWNMQLTIVADAQDSPSLLTWTVPTVAPTTTSTTTAVTSTTAAGATTTTAAGAATTTTTARATTTTVAGATTTTLGSVTTLASNTTLFSSGGVGGGGGGGGYNGSGIVATGSSPIPIVIWALLLLVFGRMALLFGRPMRVLPPKSR